MEQRKGEISMQHARCDLKCRAQPTFKAPIDQMQNKFAPKQTEMHKRIGINSMHCKQRRDRAGNAWKFWYWGPVVCMHDMSYRASLPPLLRELERLQRVGAPRYRPKAFSIPAQSASERNTRLSSAPVGKRSGHAAPTKSNCNSMQFTEAASPFSAPRLTL